MRLRRFNVSYTSVVLIVAKDLDTAVQMVVDHCFDPGDASMPIVLDVEPLDDEGEIDEEDGA